MINNKCQPESIRTGPCVPESPASYAVACRIDAEALNYCQNCCCSRYCYSLVCYNCCSSSRHWHCCWCCYYCCCRWPPRSPPFVKNEEGPSNWDPATVHEVRPISPDTLEYPKRIEKKTLLKFTIHIKYFRFFSSYQMPIKNQKKLD